MTAQRSQAVVALALTMLIWGTSAVFMRTTALTLAPENALALRYVLLVLMVVPGLFRHHRLVDAAVGTAHFAHGQQTLC